MDSSNATPTVLNVSPRKLVLRFDDSTAIDANTLAGIQVKRAGADGILSSAYLTTDLGTNGAVVLDFSPRCPGNKATALKLNSPRSRNVQHPRQTRQLSDLECGRPTRQHRSQHVAGQPNHGFRSHPRDDGRSTSFGKGLSEASSRYRIDHYRQHGSRQSNRHSPRCRFGSRLDQLQFGE